MYVKLDLENGVQKGIFGPKREEVAGGWRRLRNEELIICTLHQYY
jgi:hypothetical protein